MEGDDRARVGVRIGPESSLNMATTLVAAKIGDSTSHRCEGRQHWTGSAVVKSRSVSYSLGR